MDIRKLLLVDDSKSARLIMSRILTKHGLEVETAESGEDSFEVVESFNPDVIFMDYQMPGLNGIETMEKIHQTSEYADVPVVICTGNDADGFMDEATSKGAVTVISKPLTTEAVDNVFSNIKENHLPKASAAPASDGLLTHAQVQQMIDEAVANALHEYQHKVQEIAHQEAIVAANRVKKSLVESITAHIKQQQSHLIANIKTLLGKQKQETKSMIKSALGK